VIIIAHQATVTAIPRQTPGQRHAAQEKTVQAGTVGTIQGEHIQRAPVALHAPRRTRNTGATRAPAEDALILLQTHKLFILAVLHARQAAAAATRDIIAAAAPAVLATMAAARTATATMAGSTVAQLMHAATARQLRHVRTRGMLITPAQAATALSQVIQTAGH